MFVVSKVNCIIVLVINQLKLFVMRAIVYETLEEAQKASVLNSTKQWNAYFHVVSVGYGYILQKYWCDGAISYAFKGVLSDHIKK